MPLSPAQPPPTAKKPHAHPPRPVAPPPSSAEVAALRPASLGRRLGLFFLLLVLPVAAVSVPALVVTHFFGQRPPAGTSATALAGFETLRDSLTKSAEATLPDSSAALRAPAEITVPGGTSPAETDARFAGLAHLAERLGGSAVEKPADATGRHLFVALPAAAGDGSKRAVFEQLTTRHLDLLAGASDTELDKLIAVVAANPLVTSAASSAPPLADGGDAREFLTVTVATNSSAGRGGNGNGSTSGDAAGSTPTPR